MKKVVFRRRSQKAPIRVYVYDQDEYGSLDGGSKRDFFHTDLDDSWSPFEGAGKVRLRHVWGRIN